jgi:hypothetical protein
MDETATTMIEQLKKVREDRIVDGDCTKRRKKISSREKHQKNEIIRKIEKGIIGGAGDHKQGMTILRCNVQRSGSILVSLVQDCSTT